MDLTATSWANTPARQPTRRVNAIVDITGLIDIVNTTIDVDPIIDTNTMRAHRGMHWLTRRWKGHRRPWCASSGERGGREREWTRAGLGR